MARMISLASFRRNEVGGKIPAVNGKTAMKRGDIGDLHLLVDEDRQQRRLVPWQCPLRGSLPRGSADRVTQTGRNALLLTKVKMVVGR